MGVATTFHTPRERDARATIRGYVYQVELTIARWLDIQPGEQLELERGEDIDLVSGAVTARGDEQERILEQVKHLESVSVTLHSAQVLAALANFHAHRIANPSISLRLRFTTNAGRGRERGSSFPEGMRGLDVWEAIRQGTLQELPLGTALAGIRSLLLTDHTPDRFPQAIWRPFQDFVREASDEELSRFIQSCEWSTRTTEALALQPLIQQRLQNEYRVVDDRQAEELYSRLFLYVFRLLSQQGHKVLTVEEREQQLAMPTLSASDHAVLELLKDMHRKLEERVSELEHRVDTQGFQQLLQEEHLAKIDQQVAQLAREQGVDVAIAYINVTPILDIPPLVEHASPRTETVRNLKKKVEAYTWTAIHGNASMGKTQLAILLVRALETRCAWIRLENTLSHQQNSLRLDATCSALLDGEAPQNTRSQWYRRLAERLGRDAIIVLDDLPRLTGRDELSQRLIELARACKTQHVLLLSTSPYRLPENLRSTLGSHIVRTEAIPPLTMREATEILQEYGAPDALLASSASLNALAGRNPLLLDTMARYLQARHWHWDEQTLAALFQRQYAAAISEDVLYRLLETVEDEQSRELLYRLNFILGPFSYEDTRALAAVAPEVTRPRERLIALAGLWVERDAEERFRISPLIRTLGSEDVALPVRRACNRVLAERILQRGALHPGEVNEAILYFVEAKEPDRAGLLLIWVLSDMLHLAHPVNDAGLLALWAESPLPLDMDLGIRLHLRGLQIALRRKWGLDVSAGLISDFTSLLAQATTDQAWALLGVLLVAHDEVPNVHRALLLILGSLPQMKLPNGRLVTFPAEDHLEALIWVNVLDITTIEDLRDWIRAVELLRPEQRHYAFDQPAAEQGCQIVADRLWHKEADKSSDQQEWSAILEALQDLASRASRLHLELLWACAVRAQIMVLAERCKDLEAAATLAEAALARSSADPRVHFLLKECLGRQYVYVRKNDDALLWLQQALDVDTVAYPSEHLFTLLAASRAISPTDRETALHYALQAANLAETSSGITQLERAEAYGELGIAKWLAGRVEDAFPDWNQAGEHLFASKMEADEWKNLFMLYSYVTGYLLALVTTGHPPSEANTGGPDTTPEPGFLTRWGSRAVENYHPARDSFLMIQLSTFAMAVGQNDRAVAWAERGIDLAEQSQRTMILVAVGHEVIPLLILQGRYEKALDVALETCAATVASMLMHENLRDLASMELDIEATLGSKPNEAWNQAEREAAYMGLLPIVFHLGTIALTDPDRASILAQNASAYCRKIADSASSRQVWTSAANILDRTFVHPASSRELNTLGNTFGQAQELCLQAMSYLGATLQRDCHLRDALNAHGTIVPWVSRKYPTSSKTYRLVVLPFFSTYWEGAFGRKRVLFGAPGLVKAALTQALTEPEGQRAQAVLKAVALGLSGDASILRNL